MKQHVYLNKFMSSATQVQKLNYFFLTQQDPNMFDWVDMSVIVEGWPMTSMAIKRYHRLMKLQSRFCTNTVWTVILAMTVQVEEILAADLKVARKGSIVHDGWSNYDLHFFALNTLSYGRWGCYGSN
jgi:hypothetical protein